MLEYYTKEKIIDTLISVVDDANEAYENNADVSVIKTIEWFDDLYLVIKSTDGHSVEIGWSIKVKGDNMHLICKFETEYIAWTDLAEIVGTAFIKAIPQIGMFIRMDKQLKGEWP